MTEAEGDKAPPGQSRFQGNVDSSHYTFPSLILFQVFPKSDKNDHEKAHINNQTIP